MQYFDHLKGCMIKVTLLQIIYYRI